MRPCLRVVEWQTLSGRNFADEKVLGLHRLDAQCARSLLLGNLLWSDLCDRQWVLDSVHPLQSVAMGVQ